MKEIFGVEQLDEFIVENVEAGKVILLYFGATWCGPCKQLKKRLGEPETSKIMPKLVVGYLDVDDESNTSLVNRYKVESLPTQVFVKVDKNKVIPVSRVEGYDFTKLKLEYDNY
jgi:thiol-disulfide isomerase/thioredoxin